jgi:hypothetical protein
MAAATALGTMGPESAKPLAALIGDKSHRKNQRLQIRVTLSLGKTKSRRRRRAAVDAAQAQGRAHAGRGCRGAGQLLRRRPGDAQARVRGPAQHADGPAREEGRQHDRPGGARALEHHLGTDPRHAPEAVRRTETDPDFYQRWWNDNKKKDWGPKAG